MGKILLYSIISALVAGLVPFFSTSRNFYYLALAVVLAGGAIGIWGHESSKIEFENYIPLEVWIESASFRESDEALLIFASGQRYILTSQNLSLGDLEIVRRDGPKLAGAATIWLRPNNKTIAGITATQMRLDAQLIAVKERSLFTRFRNVGIVISIFGLLLLPFNYFTTPKVREFTRLTQKY